MADKDAPFLKRWSEQKLAEPEDAPEIEEANAVTASEATEDMPPPPDLPDVDSLQSDSDYAVFLQDGVPEQLKRAALRKLWGSSPELAVLDGLNDYDEDFSIVDGLVETVVSAYKAGKGYVDEEEESATEEISEIETKDEPETESEKGDAPEIVQNQDSIDTLPEN
ncbi:MAG: DUF3306 domain-containing protein [Alphaproteobacteria bacterium]